MSLKLEHVNVSITGKLLCKALNLEIQAGEFWGILGPNGVGKTTLLKSMCHITPITAGQIVLAEKPLTDYSDKERAQQIGLMQQEYSYFFPSTVYEAVKLGRFPYLTNLCYESELDLQMIENSLKQTDLMELKDRPIQTLSGGEKRRVHLAMLLCQNPNYFFLDEPNNHLDLPHSMKLMQILLKNQKNGKSIIMVSHEINLISHYCNKILMLFNNGTWLAGDKNQLLNEKNISLLYQHPMREINDQGISIFLPS